MCHRNSTTLLAIRLQASRRLGVWITRIQSALAGPGEAIAFLARRDPVTHHALQLIEIDLAVGEHFRKQLLQLLAFLFGDILADEAAFWLASATVSFFLASIRVSVSFAGLGVSGRAGQPQFHDRPLNCAEDDGLLTLLGAGLEGLDSVGLQLVVTLEAFIEADDLLRSGNRHRIDKLCEVTFLSRQISKAPSSME